MVSSGPSPLPASLPSRRTRAAAIGATLIVLAACLVQMVRADRACNRDFTYATDEVYVHLSLARRLATEPGGQPAAPPLAAVISESASPVWTSVLAGAVRLSRPGATPEAARFPWLPLLAPLILNLVMAGLLILLAGHLLRFDVARSGGMLVRLLVIAALMPIPLLVLTGLEHLAHAFVAVLAVASNVELIERERLAARRLVFSAGWMALAVGLRYESLALLGGLVLWAWIRRRVGRVVLPALAGLGVAVGLAIYLGTHGSSWLPQVVRTSLLGDADTWSRWIGTVLERVLGNIRSGLVPGMLVVICGALLWSRREQQSSPDAEDRIRVAWLFVFVVAGVAHVLIGRTDELFRYTAYLVPIGVVAVMRALANRPGAKWAPSAPVGLRYSVMAVFCLLPLIMAAAPAMRAAWFAPEESRQVFQLNRMPAAFVRTFFPSGVVAANEVGALRYETHARVLDLNEPEMARRWAAHESPAELAIVVDRAGYPGVGMPTRPWHPVGDWSIGGPAGAGRAYLRRAVLWAEEKVVRDARAAFRVTFESAGRPTVGGVELYADPPLATRTSETQPGR